MVEEENQGAYMTFRPFNSGSIFGTDSTCIPPSRVSLLLLCAVSRAFDPFGNYLLLSEMSSANQESRHPPFPP
ncbi:hypothetical protein AB1N83_006796 [Pleurotus pulmonarius]